MFRLRGAHIMLQRRIRSISKMANLKSGLWRPSITGSWCGASEFRSVFEAVLVREPQARRAVPARRGDTDAGLPELPVLPRDGGVDARRSPANAKLDGPYKNRPAVFAREVKGMLVINKMLSESCVKVRAPGPRLASRRLVR